MDHDHYENAFLKDILTSVRRIAVVGASPNPSRPSYGVMRFLIDKGYDVLPVNPGHAGKDILGQTVFASLADIPGHIDMVDVFRAADQLSPLVDEVLELPDRPDVIWGQLTVRNDAAAYKAERQGIKVVMDRCPAIEIPRLLR